MSKRIAVLLGGNSNERDVSLVSGRACAESLLKIGHDVYTLDPIMGFVEFINRLSEIKPDVVFNALHGTHGEDGKVQGSLDLMGVPYTHSGVLASALAMNKPVAKMVFSVNGLTCPEGQVFGREELASRVALLSGSFVMKPPADGSSVGVKIIHTPEQFHEVLKNWCFGESVLVERYIPGREITVAVRGEAPQTEALGALEIIPATDFYDYGAKYTANGSRHIEFNRKIDTRYDDLIKMAVRAHDALGCRGITRADFRYDDTRPGCEQFYLLEVNTQPGMTPTSLVPEIAGACGISFDNLVQWMVDHARADR